MPAKLILMGDQPAEYALGAFDTLGRHPDNTIQVLDRIVSKEHARVGSRALPVSPHPATLRARRAPANVIRFNTKAT